MPNEDCIVCHEATGVGSPYHSSRRLVARADGSRIFLCSDCAARGAPERRHELSDEERRRLEEHGAMFGITWNATGS